MPQDRESGSRAAKWGLETGAAIAQAIGARKIRNGSNECWLDGRRVVIKCAHERTAYVGVLSEMLDRIDAVVGAFERPDGAFDLRSMPRSDYRRFMRRSQSRSHAPHRGQQVRRADFETHGTYMQTVDLQEGRR